MPPSLRAFVPDERGALGRTKAYSPLASFSCHASLTRGCRPGPAGLGPDHPDTLAAATSRAFAQFSLGEAAAASELGEDTLQRCRRVLGRDHPITLYLVQVAVTDRPPLGDAAAEDGPSPPR